ncbi:hypothetical protein C1631_001250 [Chryseobacterium phosphatilyticum]|uniref:Uncharacterized protein n=1 Tax=Chryseobacterium phosphatilyticum TaxID=475075 RepID=A0A316XIQ3_9FLAO|nr:hypothetical protein [Chryseobacterium phosphatilyticum]PWN71278.1 hypothetical protein C1631_001250 [Chryseobacterium phosphatilyticum]
MNKLQIFPVTIIVLQLISLGHLYYTYKYGSTQIPAAFIELNILAVLNIVVLILSYFFYFNTPEKQGLWWLPITISVLIIVFTLICYIIMGIDKYK